MRNINKFESLSDFNVYLFILIGNDAFSYCSYLSEIILIDGLTTLGAGMFYMQGGATLLPSISIPSSVIIIGKGLQLFISNIFGILFHFDVKLMDSVCIIKIII